MGPPNPFPCLFRASWGPYVVGGPFGTKSLEAATRVPASGCTSSIASVPIWRPATASPGSWT